MAKTALFKPECAKFEMYKHNDEVFNIYYRIFYEPLPILTDYAN